MFYDAVKFNFDRPVSQDEIFEAVDGCHILIEMAGFRKDDINIEVNGSFLTVVAERKSDNKPSLRKTKFTKTYHLDSNKLSIDELKATLENGVLSIFIPLVLKKIGRKVEIQ